MKSSHRRTLVRFKCCTHKFWINLRYGSNFAHLELKQICSKEQDSTKTLEDKVLKLEKLKSELMIRNKELEKEVKDLNKRRNAAKAEILSLNTKLQKASTKGNLTHTDISQENVSAPVFEDSKTSEPKEEPMYEKAFLKSSRLLSRLK